MFKIIRVASEYYPSVLPKIFAYCGNSKADLEVWPDAGEIIVVNPSRGVLAGLDQEPDILFE